MIKKEMKNQNIDYGSESDEAVAYALYSYASFDAVKFDVHRRGEDKMSTFAIKDGTDAATIQEVLHATWLHAHNGGQQEAYSSLYAKHAAIYDLITKFIEHHRPEDPKCSK